MSTTIKKWLSEYKVMLLYISLENTKFSTGNNNSAVALKQQISLFWTQNQVQS